MESGSVWARLHPNMTSWPKLGPDGGGPGPSWAQSNLMRRAENLPFYRYFQRFLALIFDGGSCKAMLPTLGLSWAQPLRQMPSIQDQVAHAKPNLRPSVPKWRHVQPQLGWPASLLSVQFPGCVRFSSRSGSK